LFALFGILCLTFDGVIVPFYTSQIENKPPRKVYQYNKANTEELKEKLRSIDIEKQLKEQDLTVDQLWNNFKEKALDIMNQLIPTKMINNSKRKKNKSRMDLDFSVK
jgi:DNA-binding PadR family transcriptional regulator